MKSGKATRGREVQSLEPLKSSISNSVIKIIFCSEGSMAVEIKRRSAKKPQQKSAWQLYVLMPLCGLVVISGFFFAARQHFSSMDYGMRNSRLRKQLDELAAEKRRLLLNREISLSPSEI